MALHGLRAFVWVWDGGDFFWLYKCLNMISRAKGVEIITIWRIYLLSIDVHIDCILECSYMTRELIVRKFNFEDADTHTYARQL